MRFAPSVTAVLTWRRALTTSYGPRPGAEEVARSYGFSLRYIQMPYSENNSSDVDSAWEKEITDRAHAVDVGTARGIDCDGVLRGIESRFAP